MTSPAFYGLSLVVLYAAVLVEVVYLARRDDQPVPWREVATNMNSGQLVLWTLRGIRLVAYGWVSTHASLGLLDGVPGWLLPPLAFVLWDLAFYVSHWAHHKVPLLWDVHSVHHGGTAFNLSLAVRNGWLQVVTPTPFFLVLAVIGLPLPTFLAVGALHYIVQLYNHNGVVRDSGRLDRLFVTPTHHLVHHAKNPRYLDRNFGSALIVWDKLFGTFAAAVPAEPVEVGLADAPRTESAFWLNLAPLLRWGGRSPDFLIPAAPPDYGGGYLVVGSLLEFLLMASYIIGMADRDGAATLSLFGLIVGGTMLLGGVADGIRRDLLLWIAVATLGSAAHLAAFGAPEPATALLLGGLVLHGLWGLPRYLGRVPTRGPACAPPAALGAIVQEPPPQPTAATPMQQHP